MFRACARWGGNSGGPRMRMPEEKQGCETVNLRETDDG